MIISNKYLTKDILIEANKAAIREKRNRQLDETFLEYLPDKRLFPVAGMFYHAKDEIRILILFDGEGTRGYLDMSELRYSTLPTAAYNEDGTIYLEDEESIQERRPYPNNREWQEITVRKPVRKQGQFRNRVLEAYEYKCAICNVKNKRVLRAAHIWPVADGGKDNVQNGICLCVNHEVAYDNELFFINPDGKVVLNTNDDLKIDRMTIRFPKEEKNHPTPENFVKRQEYYDNQKNR